MAQVSLERLRKVYPNGHVAVHEASFEVGDGELLVLVGPSGCGKSTLLRMIAGLEAISDGELRIGGARVNALSPKDRDIAMVFQNYALYPHMTVAENLGFGLKLRGMPKQDVQRRVGEAAEMLEIAPLLQRRPAALSGGQRQRVALGRALVRQPQVFLLDEPLSNLDARLRAGMRVEIARLQRRIGTTMIYVTHDQIEAMTLGQRIVVLHDGRIQQIDTPTALYEHPANLFVATFLGSPAMNLIEGELTAGVDAEPRRLRIGEGLELALVPADAGAAAAGRVTLGVRPEDLVLTGPGADALPAQVEVVEAVGSEAFVYLDCAGRTLVARVPPRELPRAGDRVHCRPAAGRLHFFDSGSGERLPG